MKTIKEMINSSLKSYFANYGDVKIEETLVVQEYSTGWNYIGDDGLRIEDWLFGFINDENMYLNVHIKITIKHFFTETKYIDFSINEFLPNVSMMTPFQMKRKFQHLINNRG